MERIGVRELRQHASRYLARVRAGETIEVTDRGRAVARLVPVGEDTWEDLVASGQVLPAEDPDFDFAAVEPLDLGFLASERLDQMRADER
jgi:prevent-host-death family protein